MVASSDRLFGGLLRLFLVSSAALLPCRLRAQVLDFETLPDGSPVVDGMLISNQYNAPPYSVSFSLIGQPPSVGPRIAQVGTPMTAFQGPEGTSPCTTGSTRDDMPAPTAAVGCFFLTDDGQTPPAP